MQDDITEDLKRFNIPLHCVRGDSQEVGKVDIVSSTDSVKGARNANSTGNKHRIGGKQKTRSVPTVTTPTVTTPTVTTPTVTTPSTPTIEEIAARVQPPMQAVRTNGIVENIDSGMHITCPRGHIHHYKLTEILSRAPVCKTCSIPGAITRRIREQIEAIFSVPFYLEKKEKTHIHYAATLAQTKINLFTVKSGHNVERMPNSVCIILPESQSKILVNESIYKQCSGLSLPNHLQQRIDALAPKVEVKKDERIPYSVDFAGDVLNYKIIHGGKLYIENCGWK